MRFQKQSHHWIVWLFRSLLILTFVYFDTLLIFSKTYPHIFYRGHPTVFMLLKETVLVPSNTTTLFYSGMTTCFSPKRLSSGHHQKYFKISYNTVQIMLIIWNPTWLTNVITIQNLYNTIKKLLGWYNVLSGDCIQWKLPTKWAKFTYVWESKPIYYKTVQELQYQKNVF